MYRELTYIAFILGISAFGTELLFRFNSENQTTNAAYNLQSNMVLAATAADIIFSIYTLKIIEITMTAIKMKVITFLTFGALISAIVLRGKYQFFGSSLDAGYNLYNATSFFLSVTTVLWIPFWFFSRKEPPYIASIPLTESRNDQPIIRSSDLEVDEALPSYYELPTPPAYTKVNITEDAAVLQEEHTSGTNHLTDQARPAINLSNFDITSVWPRRS